MTTRDPTKPLFGIDIATREGDGTPVVVIGIPLAAWERMKDGKTTTFDLTKAGVPCQIVLFGCDDHDDAMKKLGPLLAPGFKDTRDDVDYSIPDAKK